MVVGHGFLDVVSEAAIAGVVGMPPFSSFLLAFPHDFSEQAPGLPLSSFTFGRRRCVPTAPGVSSGRRGVGPGTTSQHSLAQCSLAAPTYQGSADASEFSAKVPIHCFLCRLRRLREFLSNSQKSQDMLTYPSASWQRGDQSWVELPSERSTLWCNFYSADSSPYIGSTPNLKSKMPPGSHG